MSDRTRLRLAVLQLLVLTLVGTLLARLWYLQVLAGEQYERIAADNGRGTIAERATRGRILDDMGRPLVVNRTSLVVSVSNAELEKLEDDGAAVLQRLGKLIKVKPSVLKQEIKPCPSWQERQEQKITVCNNGSPLQPVPVATDVTTDVAFHIMEHREDFPGVEAKAVAVRAYPHGTLAPHVFGYLGRIAADEIGKGKYDKGYDPNDLVGRGGVEEVYDRDLKGESGLQTVAVNRHGRQTRVLETRPPRPGNDLVLSLDLNVQKTAEKALADWMAFARRTPDKNGVRKAPSGAAVVVDVKTGRVVALASNPTFDLSRFGARIPAKEYERLFGEKAGDPMVSRAVQGLFAPGSTFKLVSTAAAVEAGRAPLQGTYNCPGALRVGNSMKSNFEGRGMGPINLFTTLVESCDTVYYQFAMDEWYADQARIERGEKPREVLQEMARDFGFGSPTGIDLPDERAGLIRDRGSLRKSWEADKDRLCKLATDPSQTPYQQAIARENCLEGWRYRLGSAANDYVGQGDVLVTPLQMAMAYAALANGGTLYSPRVAKAVIGPDGKVVRHVKPKVVRELVKGPDPVVGAETLRYIANSLAAVPTQGTARGAFAAYPYGQVPIAGKTGTAEVYGKHDTSWFASYGPVADPRYAIVVMVEQAGTGGSVAAPAVRQIWDGIYGLEGHRAAFAGGEPPTALPKIAADGTITRPKLPARPPAQPQQAGVALPAPDRRRAGR
ncbi:MAG TPA: penicillin-binding protein 2 [Frankiaceae bacterium]|nr:penicillin-binding protein 2 [Frankiaceae bacterium]